jgi:hypothetical protein
VQAADVQVHISHLVAHLEGGTRTLAPSLGSARGATPGFIDVSTCPLMAYVAHQVVRLAWVCQELHIGCLMFPRFYGWMTESKLERKADN